MTITIKVNTGNAAFQDDPGELSRILRIWAVRGCQEGPLPPDSNGNQVGTVRITGR